MGDVGGDVFCAQKCPWDRVPRQMPNNPKSWGGMFRTFLLTPYDVPRAKKKKKKEATSLCQRGFAPGHQKNIPHRNGETDATDPAEAQREAAMARLKAIGFPRAG